MKVKVGNTEICGVLSNVAKIKDEWHCIITHRDGSSYAYKFNFEPIQIQDTTQIEVGSDWVGYDGIVYSVVYIGDMIVVIKEKNGIQEIGVDKFSMTDIYKPKQKTVTMYFYRDCKGIVHSYSEPMPKFGEHLFTKEIEL